ELLNFGDLAIAVAQRDGSSSGWAIILGDGRAVLENPRLRLMETVFDRGRRRSPRNCLVPRHADARRAIERIISDRRGVQGRALEAESPHGIGAEGGLAYLDRTAGRIVRYSSAHDHPHLERGPRVPEVVLLGLDDPAESIQKLDGLDEVVVDEVRV